LFLPARSAHSHAKGIVERALFMGKNQEREIEQVFGPGDWVRATRVAQSGMSGRDLRAYFGQYVEYDGDLLLHVVKRIRLPRVA